MTFELAVFQLGDEYHASIALVEEGKKTTHNFAEKNKLFSLQQTGSDPEKIIEILKNSAKEKAKIYLIKTSIKNLD